MSNGAGTLAAATLRRPGRNALSLGAANALDYLLQFLLPVVLVRWLEPDAFGQYRLLWLVAGTAMAIVTQAMAGSLFYFLPRSDTVTKRLYINQTLVFVAAAGLIAACAVSPGNPWLPDKLAALAPHAAILPVFVFLWVAASPLDLLAAAEERIAWQARTIVGLSLLRALALSLTAILTRQLEPVLFMLLAFVALRLAVLLGYVARFHGLRRPFLRAGSFAGQVRYAAPFGAAGALFGLRMQADQWVAVALFSVGQFAAFSIGAVLAPLMQLLRQPALQAFLPSMSRREAAGDLQGMIELSRRANFLVAAPAYALLAFAFVFAEDIVSVIYTEAYAEAAPVMRVYIVGLAALVCESANTMQLLRQGAFVLRLGIAVLALSAALSWLGAHWFGLAGAAAGSVIAAYVDLAATLRRIAQCTGIAVRQLQDWKALGLLMLLAAAAALLAWQAAAHSPAASAPLLRLGTGGLLMAGAYGAMLAVSGQGRDWLALLRDARGH